jgi:hypothetical protein
MIQKEFIPVIPDPPPPLPIPNRGSGDVQHDIAKADKVARTGTTEERVRETPPAGAWNDTTHD